MAMAEAALLERQGPSARPTWFEIMTAAGYHWFSDLGVQVAVAEVGLGGLWDATNAADAEVAVVTNVSIDHVEYLGSSRETIATEKAGIIKRGATLVLGEPDPGLHGIFLERDPGRVLRHRRRLRGAAATTRPTADGPSTCGRRWRSTPTSTCRSTAPTRRPTPPSPSPPPRRSSASPSRPIWWPRRWPPSALRAASRSSATSRW